MSETMITGAQARASDVAVALEKVAIAVADAAAVVADLNTALTQDRRGGKTPGSVPSYVDFEPDLGFADWRCEVLSLLEAS